MKSLEPSMVTADGGWGPSPVGDALPASSLPRPAARQSGRSDSLSNSLPDSDRTRVFLHQLSQTLTSLRGTLELALLVDADAQEYRRAIQQSLGQAERLVQLFRSFRATAEAETANLAHEEVELGELVRMLLEQLHPLADSRRLALYLGSGDNAFVRTDPGRLLVALRRGLICAIQQSPTGAKLEVSLSTKEGSACLTLAATPQPAAAHSLPECAPGPENEPKKLSASDSVEGDWPLVRRAIEGLGGSVLIIPAENSPLLCEICLPLSQPEKE